MNINSLLIIKEPYPANEENISKIALCSYINGYLDGVQELDKYILELFRSADRLDRLRAHMLYTITRELRETTSKEYNKLCENLNKKI
ncbi:hypothetical protein ACFHWD_12485 [Clostridium sp. MT-14]|jgi:hypothetical protein|uniref:Uncharacterized protein n=1 Tax=Clostridium aromativorans TaxID=2836848 RepID=A0ABS8N8B4_9CLOT|nr:hypothetical protein [Clostridium aromativorans]MCC9296050.1 hypothetical protein [Clostridium aromativorans]CAB1248825.1 conserved hypothetical protein [Clostridiaceae bacterium BL-3]